jgi:GNAT superfamily N-acetyltransferase
VDDQFRGRGIAKALLQSAIEIAREAGANGIALTSNPQRVEANQLYLRMGFKKRQTNAYFYELK